MEYGKKIRIGGFNILKFKRDDISLIKVSTIMGTWAMEYREDTKMYHALDSELDEMEQSALGVLIVNTFMVANFLDAELQHSVMLASGELQKRINAEAEPVSEEEDADILAQMKTEADIIEHLTDGEEGKTEVQV